METEKKIEPMPDKPVADRWISIVGWVVAVAAVAVATYFAWEYFLAGKPQVEIALPVPTVQESGPETSSATSDNATLPSLPRSAREVVYYRLADLHTIIPNRPREDVVDYQVDFGDSVFAIASEFGVEPETVLWANYETLNDNPDYLEPGMDLNIPPVDGVYYQWVEGDTLEDVASRFEADVDEIINWPENHIDLVDPEIAPGTFVMIPGGHREFRQWIVPTIPRGAAGVSRSVYGPGACDGGYDGAYGSGSFIYPSYNHTLSGNDYWSGHLGIDLAAGAGDGIVAADSGVVVFSGWATGGYGYMIMIDHGNGYQTVYAHLSQTIANCGASVSKGGLIGYAGSTGNSTGVHLHFEVRYQGGFISPWFVLPAP
jgi:LysM repeat protein